MVGISRGITGLEDLDQFDLLGITPNTLPRLTYRELIQHARRVVQLLHPDTVQRLTRPVPYTSAQANAFLNWLRGQAVDRVMTEDARVTHFYANVTGSRSRWNPQQRTLNTNTLVGPDDPRLYLPIPRANSGLPPERPPPQRPRRTGPQQDQGPGPSAAPSRPGPRRSPRRRSRSASPDRSDTRPDRPYRDRAAGGTRPGEDQPGQDSRSGNTPGDRSRSSSVQSDGSIEIIGAGPASTGYTRTGDGRRERVGPRPSRTGRRDPYAFFRHSNSPPSTRRPRRPQSPPRRRRSPQQEVAPVADDDDDSLRPGEVAYYRSVALPALINLANDPTNVRLVVALVPLPDGGLPVLAVTVGQDDRNRIRYQIQSYDLAGQPVDGAGRGNSIGWHELVRRGAVFLGRFHGANEQQVRSFAAAVRALPLGLAAPGARGRLPRRSQSPN